MTVGGGANITDLKIPFGESANFPGAAVVMQSTRTPPSGKNPLGDIVTFTNATGYFTIPRLEAGAYILRAASIGFGIKSTTVIVTNSDYVVPASEIVLTRGGTITGTIRKPDSTTQSGYGPVSESEVASVAAVDNGFSNFIFGTVEVDDEAKTVSKYTI